MPLQKNNEIRPTPPSRPVVRVDDCGREGSTNRALRSETIRIAVCCEKAEHFSVAHALAERLAAPVVLKPCCDFRYLLSVTERGLELHNTGDPNCGSIRIDYLGGTLGYRLAHQLGKRHPLARAVGVGTKPGMYVIDATAGMGRDALIMARLGCRVLMLERSAIIASMLSDGLLRAQKSVPLRSVIRERIKLKQVDAVPFLQSLTRDRRPDVIYLDPMYPQRKKSALVKKEMRFFRDLVGEDEDAGVLLNSALRCAIKRVVVKRPRRGESLPGPPPHRTIIGKSTRYDVYQLMPDR